MRSMKKKKTKTTTAFEKKVLDVLLSEFRRAVKKKTQMTIILDPFVLGGGAHVFVSLNESGNAYEISS